MYTSRPPDNHRRSIDLSPTNIYFASVRIQSTGFDHSRSRDPTIFRPDALGTHVTVTREMLAKRSRKVIARRVRVGTRLCIPYCTLSDGKIGEETAAELDNAARTVCTRVPDGAVSVVV